MKAVNFWTKFVSYFMLSLCILAPSSVLASERSPYLPQLARGHAWTVHDTYRIGDEWGKQPVTEDLLASYPEFSSLFFATARVRGAGTGFYIGEFAGKHLVATNHHVCPEAEICMAWPVQFTMLEIEATPVSLLGSWSDIDLAILQVELSPEDLLALEPHAQHFDFVHDLYPGQAIVTAGYGTARNPLRRQVVNFDDDCMVFSQAGEYRYMADPDELNPGEFKTWSFANGCDVSHGDSGSALVDRNSGLVLGLIWTGRIPKNPVVQDSAYLQQMLSSNSEEIWQELSYGVPALKIKSYLGQLIASGDHELSPQAAQALSDWLE